MLVVGLFSSCHEKNPEIKISQCNGGATACNASSDYLVSGQLRYNSDDMPPCFWKKLSLLRTADSFKVKLGMFKAMQR